MLDFVTRVLLLNGFKNIFHLFRGNLKRVILRGQLARGGAILNHLVTPNTSSLFLN